eukprot:scaffold11899_cov40-Prasinocladus_malaysianus.AAC.1
MQNLFKRARWDQNFFKRLKEGTFDWKDNKWQAETAVADEPLKTSLAEASGVIFLPVRSVNLFVALR